MNESEIEEYIAKIELYATGSRAGHRGFMRKTATGKISYVTQVGASPERRERAALDRKLESRRKKRDSKKKKKKTKTKPTAKKKLKAEGDEDVEKRRKAGLEKVKRSSALRAWRAAQGKKRLSASKETKKVSKK